MTALRLARHQRSTTRSWRGADDDASGTAAVIEGRVLSRTASPPDASARLRARRGCWAAGSWRRGQGARLARVGDLASTTSGEIANRWAQRQYRRAALSEPPPLSTSPAASACSAYRVDGPSRQIARCVFRTPRTISPASVAMVYRQDRFGRGGDHIAFNAEGFPAVRFRNMRTKPAAPDGSREKGVSAETCGLGGLHLHSPVPH
jgi:hypothetical protein